MTALRLLPPSSLATDTAQSTSASSTALARRDLQAVQQAYATGGRSLAANAGYVSSATDATDSAYPSDSYIWSATAGEDGTFVFYAIPNTNNGSQSSSSGSDYFAAQSSASSWNSTLSRMAVAQYTLSSDGAGSLVALYANSPSSGTLLNVYA